MDKQDVLKALITLGVACENSNKCTQCDAYNVADEIEGCAIDRLADGINIGALQTALKTD